MNSITLKSHFSSAHLYHQPLWDEQKNREVFGRCFTTHGHGHNYILEVTFLCEQGPLAEQVRQRQVRLDQLTQVLDHEHLNFVIPEFKEIIPTSENIALYFARQLADEKVINLKVYEMNNLWAEIQNPNGSPL